MRFWRYRRILPKTQIAHPEQEEIKELYNNLPRTPTDSMIPAGYTYFGQFINHDLSFMNVTDKPPAPNNRIKVRKLVQRRRAALDLDSVYGAGLDDSHVPYFQDSGKFLLSACKNGKFLDLPRRHDRIAQIADPRNDENMIIAQFQVLFMKFHNKLLRHYRRLGYRGGEQLFQLARTEVIKTYIDLTLHDFAKRLIPERVYQTVVVQKKGLMSRPNFASPRLAVEFATAAFRLHSMVRPRYTIRPGVNRDLSEIFRHTGGYAEAHKNSNTDGESLFPLDDSMIIDWRMFFKIDENDPLGAKPISPRIHIFDSKDNPRKLHSKALSEDAEEESKIDLFSRSLARGKSLRLPTGQEAFTHLKSNDKFKKVAEEIGLRDLENGLLNSLDENNSLRKNTPLWLYLMLEARSESGKVAHTRLGELGGWLVANSLVTATNSVNLPGLKEWNPADSAIYYDRGGRNEHGRTPDHISFRDLILFTYPEYAEK